jgi:hypothetical protein
LDLQAGFVAQNRWDPVSGRVDYAVSLLAPATPTHDEGVLLRVTVRALREGMLEVGVTEARLADANAVPVPLLVEPGRLHVGTAHRVYLPLLPARTASGGRSSLLSSRKTGDLWHEPMVLSARHAASRSVR